VLLVDGFLNSEVDSVRRGDAKKRKTEVIRTRNDNDPIERGMKKKRCWIYSPKSLTSEKSVQTLTIVDVSLTIEEHPMRIDRESKKVSKIRKRNKVGRRKEIRARDQKRARHSFHRAG